jgi:hypothetical protein
MCGGMFVCVCIVWLYFGVDVLYVIGVLSMYCMVVFWGRCIVRWRVFSMVWMGYLWTWL